MYRKSDSPHPLHPTTTFQSDATATPGPHLRLPRITLLHHSHSHNDSHIYTASATSQSRTLLCSDESTRHFLGGAYSVQAAQAAQHGKEHYCLHRLSQRINCAMLACFKQQLPIRLLKSFVVLLTVHYTAGPFCTVAHTHPCCTLHDQHYCHHRNSNTRDTTSQRLMPHTTQTPIGS